MIKEITSGYKKFFAGFFKVLLLCISCLGIGFIIVLPLWKWASSSPHSYTIAMLAVIASLFVFWIVRCCRKYSVSKVAFVFLRIFIIAATIALCFYLVLSGRRLIALAVLIAGIIIFSVVNFGLNKDARH